jgi:hypothetical protein
MTHRTQLESALASAVQELPDLELEILTWQATRNAKGRRKYGPLMERLHRVNWDRECSEEIYDALFYIACVLMKRMEANGR